MIYPISCITLIMCKNGYFAIDDVALIYATSVQRLALKQKKAGILNGFPPYFPTQSGDPHFLFQI